MSEPMAAIVVRAAELTARGLPRQAIDLLRPLLAVHPTHAEGWCRLAAAHLDAGQPDAALDAAKRVLLLEGDHTWAHRLAALSLSELGRHTEAVVAARECVRRKPGDWRCHVVLSEVLAHSAAAEAGGRDAGRGTAGRGTAGGGAAAMGLEAVAAGREAARLAPTEARAFQVLGDAALRVRDWGTAEWAYRTALTLDPSDEDVRANLATVRRKRMSHPGRPHDSHPSDRTHKPRSAWRRAREPHSDPTGDQRSPLGRPGEPHADPAHDQRSGRGRPSEPDSVSDPTSKASPAWDPTGEPRSDPPREQRSARGRRPRKPHPTSDPARDRPHEPHPAHDRLHEPHPAAYSAPSAEILTAAHHLIRPALSRTSLLLVGGGLLLLLAGMPKPTPLLGWFSGVLVLGVLAVVGRLLLRARSGGRRALFALPKHRPAVAVVLGAFGLSTSVLAGWSVALLVGATTMQPLVIAWLCALIGSIALLLGGPGRWHDR
ncbi:tetratricopeptide repeat protein [Saccharothrix obliqua]|uniref:tetratricopeptide repeat protein n=1 Tax=Saccharothrix obliqua TaxID=2861747 RepID=UPI0027E312C1|nr:tetratricopeptide repeat protein [Saccharothrix obliqua]